MKFQSNPYLHNAYRGVCFMQVIFLTLMVDVGLATLTVVLLFFLVAPQKPLGVATTRLRLVDSGDTFVSSGEATSFLGIILIRRFSIMLACMSGIGTPGSSKFKSSSVISSA